MKPQSIIESSYSLAIVKSCSDTGINIYITKDLFINTTLNDNMKKITITSVNMVNVNSL